MRIKIAVVLLSVVAVFLFAAGSMILAGIVAIPLLVLIDKMEVTHD